MRLLARVVSATVGSLATVAGALLIGIGIPLLWIWIGSHVQKTTAPSAPALLTVMIGILLSYLAVIALITALKAFLNPPQGRQQANWMRSMRDSPIAPATDRLDDMVVLAAVITALASAVLLLAFGDPGTRPG